MPDFGLAFTAHNRQSVLDDTLAAVKTHTPADIPVVVVDDGSTPPLQVPDWVQLIRHDTAQGIPAGKNAGITALMDLGVEHLLLFDEDTRPCASEWWLPYTSSPEPHLQYSWEKFANGRRVPKMDVLYRDLHLIGYAWSMGCAVYIHRSVIDRIGGYDPVFAPGYEEHAEFSQRAHNAGFTSFVHQDVPAMKGRIWAADEHGAVKRSFDWGTIKQLVDRNEKLRLERADSDAYIEYRQPLRDIILTSFFTSHVDPQRGRKLQPDPAILEPLEASCAGHELVVLHDCFDRPNKVEAPWCAYQQRWLSQFAYLRQHPEIRWVWCVDATDTQLLRAPWTVRAPGTLFVGYEPQLVGCDWIRRHCPTTHKQWVDEHADEQLLNPGVVGGDRDTVMKLCRRMTDWWIASDRKNPLYEMLAFNVVAREFDYVTGPKIVTLFKTNAVDDPTAIWRHK